MVSKKTPPVGFSALKSLEVKENMVFCKCHFKIYRKEEEKHYNKYKLLSSVLSY